MNKKEPGRGDYYSGKKERFLRKARNLEDY
jgi:hypothetical protein